MCCVGICILCCVIRFYFYRIEEDEDELLYGDSEINITVPESTKSTSNTDSAATESSDSSPIIAHKYALLYSVSSISTTLLSTCSKKLRIHCICMRYNIILIAFLASYLIKQKQVYLYDKQRRDH